MIMTGQMKRYRESLKETPEPILLSQIQTKMDLRLGRDVSSPDKPST